MLFRNPFMDLHASGDEKSTTAETLSAGAACAVPGSSADAPAARADTETHRLILLPGGLAMVNGSRTGRLIGVLHAGPRPTSFHE
jgi:hypothetical protein